MIALMTAGGEPIAPTSPQPFDAQRVVRAERDLGRRPECSAGRRRAAWCSPSSSRTAAGRPRRRRAFSSSAWPMPCATPPCTWPSTIIGLITRAHVVHRGEVRPPRRAGLRVDLHLGDVAAAGEGEVLRIVERGLFQAGLQLLDRVVVRHVGGQRDVGQRLRSCRCRRR